MNESAASASAAECIAVAAVTAMLHGSVPHEALYPWALWMGVTLLIRFGLWMRLKSLSVPGSSVGAWEKGLTLTWSAAGLGWGALVLVFFPAATTLVEAVILLLLAALLVVSIEFLQASRRIFLAYLLLATVPAAWHLLFSSDGARAVMGAIVLAFAVLLALVSKGRSRAFIDGLAARLQSEVLVGELATKERSLRQTIDEEMLIFETTPAGICIVRERRLERCNRRMEEMFGYSPGEMQGAFTGIPSEDEGGRSDEFLLASLESATGSTTGEQGFHRRDGTSVWCRYRGRLIDPEHPDRGAIWVFEDLTEQKRAAEEMRRSEEQIARAAVHIKAANLRLTDAVECVPDALALFDRTDRLVLCNRRFLEAFPVGPAPESLQGMTYEEIVVRALEAGMPPPVEYRRDLAGWVAALMRLHRDPGGADLVYQNGDGRWWQLRERPTAEGGVVTTRIDVTELKRSEERVRHLAHHDPLTGLPNRRLLDDRLTQAISLARRSGYHVGVMLIDLDQFKSINDMHGHEVGDAVLTEVGQRLRGTVRQADTVARLGGDEFVVVLPELRRSSDASRVAKKILQSLRKPVEVGQALHSTGASIGIALFPADGQDPEALMKQADLAMYRAKKDGRGRFEFVTRVPFQAELELD